MIPSQIAGVLTPILAQFDLELDALEVLPAGKRRLLRVVVDGEGPTGTGPLLDDIARASRALSAALDESDAVGPAAYTLEVSSRGVGRPLELPRHWRRNTGRLVQVTSLAGEQLTGRIVRCDEESVTLDLQGQQRSLPLAQVTRAIVQIEMNRKSGPPGPAEDEPDDLNEEI
jgi:ribosome maturation factor RimP